MPSSSHNSVVLETKAHLGSNLGLGNASIPMYEVYTNEKIERFVNMYIFYDVSLLLNPLQNAQQHQHTCTCKKKNNVVLDVIIHCLPCVKQKF
jgi:hypothetical protein